MPRVNVHFLPAMVAPEALAGSVVVAVDVLRATTTMLHALAHGAKQVVACLEVDEACQVAKTLGADVLLGGERGGVRIPGFDLGNSPAEYVPQRVAGKTIVMTTTNGTRAIRHGAAAKRILIGAFVNLGAICHELADEPLVDVVCAGTGSEVTREDVLFAGALAVELSSAGRELVLNDQAELAADAWRSLQEDLRTGKPLAEALRASLGARNLIELGMDRDIEIAAQVDRFDFVAEVQRSTWTIVRSH